MSSSIEEKNKAIVLQAFDTLFNQRDYDRAERFWCFDIGLIKSLNQKLMN